MYLSKNTIFIISVYLISIYLIFIPNSTPINIIGYIILLSHLYKDFTKLDKWPLWCDFIGIILAIILMYNGLLITNYFITFIGLLKFFAHIRQIILQDNCYYYNS